jgi:hypothetical protein
MMWLAQKRASVEVTKLWGAPPGGGGQCWSPGGGGASCVYEGHIYFERNMGARRNIYFCRHFAWYKYEVSFYNLNFTQVYINLDKYAIH